jgi:predicted 2-oxoglutarate/Fe(II)-dependent dioxygenase YbiX
MSELLMINNFISKADCQRLIECHQENHALTRKFPNAFWNNRSLYFEAIPDSFRDVKLKIRSIILREASLINNHFRHTIKIFPETINLVVWPPGYELKPHIDNEHLDGTSNGMEQRTFSAVVYLNDNYEGGEIYFPAINASVKPTMGQLVAFRSSRRHMHGVRDVTRGLRYTMPAWFTDRPAKANHALLNYVQ